MTPAVSQADPRSREALVEVLRQAGGLFDGAKVYCPFHLDLVGVGAIFAGSGSFRYKCRVCGAIGDAAALRERLARDTWGPLWSPGRNAGRALAPRDPAADLGDILDAQMDGRFVNHPWPWSWLTELVQALTPGSRLGIVGPPGTSKSLFLTQALGQWMESGLRVAALELERSRGFHLARVLAQRAGIADITRASWIRANAGLARAVFAEHREFLNRIGRAIYTSDKPLTSDEVATWLEERAGEGVQIAAVDPVSARVRRGDPWIEDESLLARAEQTVRASGMVAIFVLHPRKGGSGQPDLDNLLGGAAWARSLDSVIWIESHEIKNSRIRTSCGTDEQQHNRTVYLLKTRSGEGENVRIAYRFQTGKDQADTGALTLRELGPIVRRKKGSHDE